VSDQTVTFDIPTAASATTEVDVSPSPALVAVLLVPVFWSF
jgi:hypothetical protein